MKLFYSLWYNIIWLGSDLMDQDKFGKLIKDIRKKNNLTQKQLADKYGVT